MVLERKLFHEDFKGKEASTRRSISFGTFHLACRRYLSKVLAEKSHMTSETRISSESAYFINSVGMSFSEESPLLHDNVGINAPREEDSVIRVKLFHFLSSWRTHLRLAAGYVI